MASRWMLWGLVVLVAACRKPRSTGEHPAPPPPRPEPPLVAPPVLAPPDDGNSLSVVVTDGGVNLSGHVDLGSPGTPVHLGTPGDIPEASFDPTMNGRSFTRPLGEMFVFVPNVAEGNTVVTYACSKPVSKTLGKPEQDHGSDLWSWTMKTVGKHTISVDCKSPKTKKKHTTTVTVTAVPKR